MRKRVRLGLNYFNYVPWLQLYILYRGIERLALFDKTKSPVMKCHAIWCYLSMSFALVCSCLDRPFFLFFFLFLLAMVFNLTALSPRGSRYHANVRLSLPLGRPLRLRCGDRKRGPAAAPQGCVRDIASLATVGGPKDGDAHPTGPPLWEFATLSHWFQCLLSFLA